LKNVQFAHSAEALLEFDMTIVEEIDMPDNRMETVLAQRPVAGIIAGQGQLGYPRQGSMLNFNYYYSYELLPALVKFGGPPIWESLTISQNSFDAKTGRIWMPAGFYSAFYTQVRIYYVAGFQYASLPSQIKQACANIVLAQNDLPVYGNFKSVKQGDTQVSYWNSSILDGDTMNLLNPFRVNAWV